MAASGAGGDFSRRQEWEEEEKRHWCFPTSKQIRLHYCEVAGPVNKCHGQKKNRVSDTRSEPRTDNPRALTVE